MQGTVLSANRHPANRLVALGCAALLAGVALPGIAADAQVSIEVAQGKTSTVRLRHLPRGTRIGIAISASGKLGVALVSATQLKSSNPEALFRGEIDRAMSFQVAIPETSDYYLVLDNRRGAESVKVRAKIQAVQGQKKPPAQPAPAIPKGGRLDQTRATDMSRA